MSCRKIANSQNRGRAPPSKSFRHQTGRCRGSSPNRGENAREDICNRVSVPVFKSSRQPAGIGSTTKRLLSNDCQAVHVLVPRRAFVAHGETGQYISDERNMPRFDRLPPTGWRRMLATGSNRGIRPRSPVEVRRSVEDVKKSGTYRKGARGSGNKRKERKVR